MVSLAGNAQASATPSKNQTSLVYVKIGSPDDLSRFSRTSLPMYARLDGGLLTAADSKGQQTIQAAGLQIQILDADPRPGVYYLAEIHSSQPAIDFASYGRVLLTTPHGALLRLDPSRVDALNRSGVELQAITLTPKPLPVAQSQGVAPASISPDPVIQGMIDQVTQTQVYTYDKQLAGYLPVWVDGGWYTIPTRYTYSGTPIQKTTNFVGQHMADLGMNVDYHVWNNSTNPDVVGEIPGQLNPENIFIIGAHIDDVSGAPGADDNGSGSVATLLAADILSQFQWGCTLRFAFWTGEEQGLLGSESYAHEAYINGENIVGYLNLDMIAWNTLGSDPYINLIYSNSIPHSQELAQLFADVIPAYNLNLLSRLGTGISGSDHLSFW